MWRLIGLFSLGGLVGCETTRYSVAKAPQTTEFAIIKIGDKAGYLIDPRTETCLVWSELDNVHPVVASGIVDCAKLKAAVPNTARYVTWDTRAAKP